MISARLVLSVVGILVTRAGITGEIAGAPVPVLPSIPTDIYLYLGNDAFGRVTEDDFRTQQSIVSGRISDDWQFVVDYSILTIGAQSATRSLGSGRLDQLSGSIGYRFYSYARDNDIAEVAGGLGFRATGNFQGARVQNAWHRLAEDRIVRLKYVDSNGVDAIAWINGSLQDTLTSSAADEPGGWNLGYWIDGTALVSTGGQVDGSAGFYGFGEHGVFRIWLGARGDIRQGYSQDIVQSATADTEQGFFAVIGLSLGPLIVQTAQALDSGARSFGSISLTAVESQGQQMDTSRSQIGGQVAVLLPSVSVSAQVRFSPKSINSADNRNYRTTLVGEFLYGEPPYNDSALQFVETRQVTLQAEFETQFDEWIKPYISLGAGWRAEKIVSDPPQRDSESSSIDRLVGLAELGLRFDAAGKGEDWALQLQLGARGWVPFSDGEVTVGNSIVTLQQPGLAFSAGVTASFYW